MEPPHISVVLPTYNRQGSLGRAIGSVLGQTFENLELIVVDDGSTDDTGTLLSSFDDPRLLFIRTDGPRGAAVARNEGIKRARGTLVAFLDSDDEWVSTKLAEQVALLDRSGAHVGAVGGAYIIHSPDERILVRSHALETASDYEGDLLEGPCCITPVWLVRREALADIDGFDESLPCLEDWDLLLRLSQVTTLTAVATPVLHKYGSPDSLGANLERRLDALTSIEERHGTRWRQRRRDDAKLCLELVYLNVVQHRPRAAARHLRRGLRRRVVGPADLLRLTRACVDARRGGPQSWPIRG